MSAPEFSYSIDDHDRLVAADPGYLTFARENGWEGAEKSIGASLWDFVSGATMRKVLETLLRRVRETGGLVELPFRCDSPTARREMTIAIEAQPGGGILFSALLHFEQARPRQALLDPAGHRGPDLVEMCGWCDRFFVGDRWLEVEDAAVELGLTTRDDLPAISHGICARCSAMLLAPPTRHP